MKTYHFYNISSSFDVKGSVREKWKGVLANIESNSMVIATNLTSICCVCTRRKGIKKTHLKNIEPIQIHEIALFYSDRK